MCNAKSELTVNNGFRNKTASLCDKNTLKPSTLLLYSRFYVFFRRYRLIPPIKTLPDEESGKYLCFGRGRGLLAVPRWLERWHGKKWRQRGAGERRGWRDSDCRGKRSWSQECFLRRPAHPVEPCSRASAGSGPGLFPGYRKIRRCLSVGLPDP